MKIAVVTGCAGFIGSHLTKLLLDNDWYVHGIDKLTYVANRDFINNLECTYTNRFSFHCEDITDLDRLPDCDVIFNLAAESDVDSSNNNSAEFVLSNVLGVQNLLKLVSTSNIIKVNKPLFIQVSTDEVYGDIDTGLFDEDSPLNPSNPYAATKAAADLLIMAWHRTFGLDYIIVRPTNNYGERQFPEKLIPLAVKQLVRGQKIKLHNNGTPERTWLHVQDTVEGILYLYEFGKLNNVYNLSSYFTQSNLDTVTQIIDYYFTKESVEHANYIDWGYNRPGQDIRYAIECKKAHNLGWRATRDFDIELQKLVEHYKHNTTW